MRSRAAGAHYRGAWVDADDLPGGVRLRAVQAAPVVAQVSNEDNGERWTLAVTIVTFLTVFAITAITAAVSYEHEYELARHNGQVPWVSSVLPFTVDGMILGASVVLLWAGAQGIRHPARPLAVLLVGISATIAANLASGWSFGWLGAAVSAWSGFALIMMSDVGMWLTAKRRELAGGVQLQRDVNCSCPPPPTSLAEAVPAARAALKAAGLPHGEEVLADRFGTTRHQLRKVLVAPVDVAGTVPPLNAVPAIQLAALNGDGHA